MSQHDSYLALPGGNLSEPELLRAIRYMISAEYDAIEMYEKILNATTDARVKAVTQEVIDDEKEHVGAFQKLLVTVFPKEKKPVNDGITEATDILKSYLGKAVPKIKE